MNVSDLNNQKRLPAPIQVGRWYDITLEVDYDKVDCYLDGKLLMSYTEPQKIFSIAGRDNKNGDIIIKVVNAAAAPYSTTITLNGLQEVAPAADVITLRSDVQEAENSFADPVKYVPVRTTITGVNKSFETIFQPYSISVLRIKDKTWKRTAK
jgi:alpha-L-arabinofuranosidase